MGVLERLSQHPMSAHFKDFIMTYRTPIIVELSQMTFPEVSFLNRLFHALFMILQCIIMNFTLLQIQSSEDGRSFVKASGILSL